MEDNDDIAAEYDFPDLHRRAKERGREYKGAVGQNARKMIKVAAPECDDPDCPCYNNEEASHPPQTKEGPP